MNSGFVPVKREVLRRLLASVMPEIVADGVIAEISALEQPVVEHYVWRPIDTAPKNGAAVLVMRDIWPGTPSGRAESCNGHNTYVAEWRDGDNAWVCYMDAVCDPHCPVEPTHWMPLPRPPSAPQPAHQPACVSGSCPNKSGCDAAQHCCYTAHQQVQQQVDWTQVGKLIEVIHDQRVRQNITGTSNWAAAVCRLMEEETRPVKKEERP